MVCGLGSSGNLVIEGFHGVEFDRPLRRIREYTEIIKMLLSGQRLQYEGEIYTLQRGFRLLGFQPVREDLPVWIAAITPRSIQQTGEIADGIYPIHWPKKSFEPLKRQLAGASRDAGRPEDSVTIAPFTNVYVTGEGDDESVWRNARQPLFHYTNRMGSFYWQMPLPLWLRVGDQGLTRRLGRPRFRGRADGVLGEHGPRDSGDWLHRRGAGSPASAIRRRRRTADASAAPGHDG